MRRAVRQWGLSRTGGTTPKRSSGQQMCRRAARFRCQTALNAATVWERKISPSRRRIKTRRCVTHVGEIGSSFGNRVYEPSRAFRRVTSSNADATRIWPTARWVASRVLRCVPVPSRRARRDPIPERCEIPPCAQESDDPELNFSRRRTTRAEVPWAARPSPTPRASTRVLGASSDARRRTSMITTPSTRCASHRIAPPPFASPPSPRAERVSSSPALRFARPR